MTGSTVTSISVAFAQGREAAYRGLATCPYDKRRAARLADAWVNGYANELESFS